VVSEPFRAKDTGPFFERQIASHDSAAAFVTSNFAKLRPAVGNSRSLGQCHQRRSLQRMEEPCLPPQATFMGITPKKSRLPISTPQWRRIA
jgi:hypothetical protein